MPEKSMDELFNEIQQALIERTNKYAKTADEDLFSAISLSMYLKCQTEFLSMIASYDALKESVKKFHKFVLEDMDI